jgi:molecular chaperone GrpE
MATRRQDAGSVEPAGDEEARYQDPDSAVSEADELQLALDAERDRNLRLRADYENLRRRALSEQDAARRGGHRAALVPMLPVFDALERALEAGSTDPEFYEGVASTLRLFEAALREAGAEPIPTVGRPFDPHSQEAVDTTTAEDDEEGTVVREVRRGWRRGPDLLRPAQVVVAGSRPVPDPDA